MPLFSVNDTSKPINSVPYQREFAVWKARLTVAQRRRIVRKLNSMIDSGEIHTTSWMPGHNWGRTVFNPIWSKACRKNGEAAAKCFGLFVWEVIMARPEDWCFGRYEKDNIPIEGLTYFRIWKRKSQRVKPRVRG